ncbi:MAG: recombinase-like helix-turn-helix domain-containing protein [Pusillimonas sp.]
MLDRYLTPCYLEPHQARTSEPTAYENLLGDTLERAYASGVTTIESLAAFLNEQGPQPLTTDLWTPDVLTAELARLAAD